MALASKPSIKKTKVEEKFYTKTDVARMLNAYCEHVLTAIMRREDHVKIADYIEQPLLINENVLSAKYLETHKLFGANG